MKKVFFYKEIILYLILLFPATILTGPALPEIFKFLIIIFFFLSVLEEKKKILFNIPSVIFYIFILILLLSALYSDYKINYSSTIFYIRHWWLVLAIIYMWASIYVGVLLTLVQLITHQTAQQTF